MCNGQISQLQSTILLALLSLIPNHVLRYTLLVLTVSVALIYAIHLKRLSVQLHQLEEDVNRAEEIIRVAVLYCARDVQVGLAEQGVRLLDVYFQVNFCDVSNPRVKRVYGPQLMVESQRQDRYTEDIDDAEAMLAGFCARAILNVTLSVLSSVSEHAPIRFCATMGHQTQEVFCLKPREIIGRRNRRKPLVGDAGVAGLAWHISQGPTSSHDQSIDSSPVVGDNPSLTAWPGSWPYGLVSLRMAHSLSTCGSLSVAMPPQYF
ncbi:hypothetical protein DFH07DRAFT_1027781 [Mycena maculata]|uniref:Uncharacterized protein n=1 Tax=Mycena maculata TaxID=230809 RepID=A0AAD7J344_9AGAR|nr:hypothetical protein DFH07DRAFT_1027781 [Mycena maculata]